MNCKLRIICSVCSVESAPDLNRHRTYIHIFGRAAYIYMYISFQIPVHTHIYTYIHLSVCCVAHIPLADRSSVIDVAPSEPECEVGHHSTDGSKVSACLAAGAAEKRAGELARRGIGDAGKAAEMKATAGLTDTHAEDLFGAGRRHQLREALERSRQQAAEGRSEFRASDRTGSSESAAVAGDLPNGTPGSEGCGGYSAAAAQGALASAPQHAVGTREMSGMDSGEPPGDDEEGVQIASWRAPPHPTAPLAAYLGGSVPERPAWYNSAASGCTSVGHTQLGSTCGLFAVNHALASAASLGLTSNPAALNLVTFENNALSAGIADSPENLVQPGGANYDWSVLHANLDLNGLASHPMAPAGLEGRLQGPFEDFFCEGAAFRSAAYILRTPQAGGHWIALAHPSVLGLAYSEALAAVLCDSLQPSPFLLTLPETEDLLTACALEGIRSDGGFGHDIQWGCFLVTGPGTTDHNATQGAADERANDATRSEVEGGAGARGAGTPL